MPASEPSPQPPSSSPCRHLRHAGMLVRSDGLAQSQDPNHDYDNTIHWCLKTTKGFGPDDDMVDGRACRDPSRSCHQPL